MPLVKKGTELALVLVWMATLVIPTGSVGENVRITRTALFKKPVSDTNAKTHVREFVESVCLYLFCI